MADAQLTACAIAAVFTLLNVLGAREVGRLQTALTVLKLLVIAGFLGLGFAIGQGDTAHFSAVAARTSSMSLFEQFATSLVFVFFSYSGWNAAVYVAGEIEKPEKTLPVALVVGTLLVTALYVALNVLYIYGASLEELKGVVAVGAEVASALFGSQTARLFSLAMALSLLATVNAMCLVGPRVYYAMAQDRAFFPLAARIHPRWKTPWVAVLMQGACTVLLIVFPTFRGLVIYIGFTLYLFTALAVLGLFKFRRLPGWKRFLLARSYISAHPRALCGHEHLGSHVLHQERSGSVGHGPRDRARRRAGLSLLHLATEGRTIAVRRVKMRRCFALALLSVLAVSSGFAQEKSA